MRSLNLRRVSAPGMILFAFSLTFASVDWIMSLDAHWFSTMFGVYVFSGSLLGALALFMVIVVVFRQRRILNGIITIEHINDLGRLMFAFTVFWAYIGFSQYFLIWYGNIPEETFWYLNRWEGSWKIVSMLILFGHFILPFAALLTRASKRNIGVVTSMGLWILLMHWIDMYWLVMPNLHPHGVHLTWMDITTVLGIGGIFMGVFWYQFSSKALVPVNDPRLDESIEISH